MNKAAATLQVVGLAAVAYGLSLVALWAGIVTAGVGLILLGLAMERGDSETT